MRQPVSPAVAWILALAGASAVAFGAFGAHALRGTLDARGLELWKTAVDYHFWHALAFGLAALVPLDGRARRIALSAFAIGIVLFSGSLYALALGAPRWTGIVTPFGGAAFIVGWLALGLAMLRREA